MLQLRSLQASHGPHYTNTDAKILILDASTCTSTSTSTSMYIVSLSLLGIKVE